MTIKNVTKVDGGLYTAKISNNVSDASAEFTLAVRDKPDKPTGTLIKSMVLCNFISCITNVTKYNSFLANFR